MAKRGRPTNVAEEIAIAERIGVIRRVDGQNLKSAMDLVGALFNRKPTRLKQICKRHRPLVYMILHDENGREIKRI
jgi:hypothetical protein